MFISRVRGYPSANAHHRYLTHFTYFTLRPTPTNFSSTQKESWIGLLQDKSHVRFGLGQRAQLQCNRARIRIPQIEDLEYW